MTLSLPVSVSSAIVFANQLPADHALAVVGTHDATGNQVFVILKKDPHWTLVGGAGVTPAKAWSWTAGVVWSI